MPPTSNQSASSGIGGLGATLNPIKNPKNISIQQVENGFLLSAQNVDTYGSKNCVALDLEGAIKIAQDYFA